MKHIFRGPADFEAAVGRHVGTSDWVLVDQDQVDDFARLTDDHQWIHVDPERAARGPFGATIIHGFLTLSLVPSLLRRVIQVEGHRLGLNYGLNKVRFPSPAPVGSRLHASVSVESVETLRDGVQVVWLVRVEAQGLTKPVCVAEQVIRYQF